MPIEDSAAPILDAAGQVIGVVLVFHYAHGTYNYGRVSDLELMVQMGHSTRVMMDRYARLARLNAGTMYNLYLTGAEGDPGKEGPVEGESATASGE